MAGIALLAVVPAAAEEAEDEVVAGHTTYASFEADSGRTISVIGDLECHVEILEIDVGPPPSVGNVDADCSAGVQVFGSRQAGPDPMAHALNPTGRTFETEGPQGETWTTMEYAFEVAGEEHRAWSVTAQEPKINPETGERYSFVAAFPADIPDGERIEMDPVRDP